MSAIRLVIIEDHDLTRIGLRATLQQHSLQVVGEAADGKTGLQLLKQLRPDVAIIDIDLPDKDGIAVTQELRSHQTDQPEFKTRVLMLTMHEKAEKVLAAFAAGADSYCVKTIKTPQLLEAIYITHAGRGWIDPAIADIVLSQVRSGQIAAAGVNIQGLSAEESADLATNHLTQRELQVLELIVAGYSNVEIGEKLFLSLGTVKTHVRNILNKLAASDRTQAAVKALRAGLVR